MPTTRFIPYAAVTDYAIAGRAWLNDWNLIGDTSEVVTVGGASGTTMRGLFIYDWRRQSDGAALSSIVPSGGAITRIDVGVEMRSSGLARGDIQWVVGDTPPVAAKNDFVPGISTSFAVRVFSPLAFTLTHANGLRVDTTRLRLAMTLGLSVDTLELRRAYLDVTHADSASSLFIGGTAVTGVFLGSDPVESMFLNGEQVW